jgi:glycine C-acetyltransferase
VVATVVTLLGLLEQEGPALVAELHEKSAYMRKGLTQLGFDLGKSNTHIMPPLCSEESRALFMHLALLENGVLMVPLVYPSVKRGDERLRLNVTRGHTREDMDKALSLLETYGKAFFVLGQS